MNTKLTPHTQQATAGHRRGLAPEKQRKSTAPKAEMQVTNRNKVGQLFRLTIRLPFPFEDREFG